MRSGPKLEVISAALCSLCVKGNFNAENAEGRREMSVLKPSVVQHVGNFVARLDRDFFAELGIEL